MTLDHRTRRLPQGSRIQRVAIGAGSIVELWPPPPPEIPPDDVLIADAWQSTGDIMRDAIAEIEREQEETGSTEEIEAGSDARIEAGSDARIYIPRRSS